MENDDINEFIYNPVEPNFYCYKGKDLLIENIEEKYNLNDFENIYICPYEVNSEGMLPFLKILLHKNSFYNKLDFLKMFVEKKNTITTENLIDLAKNYLYELMWYEKYTYANFNEIIEINGFFVTGNDLFIFADLTNCKLNINDIYSENNLWFISIYEIYNIKQLCNFKIDSFVVQFFNNNYYFCILENEKNEIYEIPIIGYVAKLENKLNFTYHFGETQKDKSEILGNNYYFTDYKNAIKNAYDLTSNIDVKQNSGIVRFALFTGKTKYIENFPNDNIDDSETKKQRLNDETLDKNYEQLTVRISDHDSLWSKDYDTAYLGNILLENGTYLKNTPLWVLKNYEQQVPLSYHFINKKAFVENNNFLII
jgi:hypothetical protein